MPLEFDGVVYRTIDDVKKEFRVAEKTVRKWINEARVPPPEMITVGARRFRHFNDAWMEAFRAELEKTRKQ